MSLPSTPTVEHHPRTLLTSIPSPHSLLTSVAAAAHYTAPKTNPANVTLDLTSTTTRRVSRSRRIAMADGEGRMLNEEELPEARRRVLEDVRQLFCSKPTVEIFQRSWRRECEFQDPLSKAVGIKEVAAQWYGMPKAFPQSRTLSSRLLSSTPTQMVYSQRQEYTIRGFGVKKVIESLVVIDLDPSDRIVKLQDLWSGEDPPTKWGIGLLRRLNGATLPYLIRIPKEVLRID